jgi:hypothetical protein
MLAKQFHGLAPIIGLSDNTNICLAFEQRHQPLCYDGMIVGNQDANDV